MDGPAKARRVLVLGEEVRSTLSVIRSLGRGGIGVQLAWHLPDSEALHSRYLKKAHDLPAFRADDDAWKRALISLMSQERFDLVLPCSDPAQIPLQAHRQELERYGKVYLLDDAVFEQVIDKPRMSQLARAAGVPVPTEWVVTCAQEAEALLPVLKLPVVLKPQSSFDPANVGHRRRVRKAYSWGDYLRLVKIMQNSGSVTIQENFIGEGVGVELLLNAGKPLLSFQHRRLHEPLYGGGSSYRESVAVAPELLEAALAILRPLAYTGVAMVEFKVNPQTGAWVFIEVNGRFWGSLPLAIAAGADFPLALFQFLIEGRTAFPQRHRIGICCRNWRLDRFWLAANLRANRSDPTLATRPLWQVVWETAVNAITLREHSDCFTWDDPRPGLAEWRLMAREAGESFQKKMLRVYLDNRWTRRLLRRRARSAWAKGKSVLFICLGNICRSPFAEHLARKESTTGRTFHSAGYHRHTGRPCPDLALSAAAKWGVDLSAHQSQLVTVERVRAADAIFVFDMANYEWMWARFPFARRCLHLLGALSPGFALIIADPYGSDAQAFDETYERISEAIASGRS